MKSKKKKSNLNLKKKDRDGLTCEGKRLRRRRLLDPREGNP